MDSKHTSVLLQETIEGLLAPQQAGKLNQLVVVDGTFGGGGHSKEMCAKYPGVKIIAIDQDKGAWERAKSKFDALDCKISFHNANFRDMDAVLKEEGIQAVDGVVLDLGLSSDQLESSLRGFSFLKNEPLLMTMKENPSREDVTALDIVNTWSEQSLADIIYGYGEERFSRRIARGIVEARRQSKIETTFDLIQIISEAVPGAYRRGKLHFATKTFQALRIAVNDELGTLKQGLAKGFDALKSGGRMAVISFHSLEDRIVKQFFKEKQKEGFAILIHKKPIKPSIEEITHNKRARSAKLRVLEKNKE